MPIRLVLKTKGTVSVILSNLSVYLEWHVRFTTISLKLLLDCKDFVDILIFLAGNYVPRNRADKVWNGTVVNQTYPFFTWKVTQNHDYSLFYKIQITYNVKKRTLKRCKNQECWTLKPEKPPVFLKLWNLES